MPTAEEFIEYCGGKKVCPYEINKMLVREAVVVVVPYIYVFDKTIRIMLCVPPLVPRCFCFTLALPIIPTLGKFLN